MKILAFAATSSSKSINNQLVSYAASQLASKQESAEVEVLNINDFEHKAFFNTEKSRIEMHLIANKDLTINSPFLNSEIKIKKGENIHTENSYKFTTEQIENFATISGLTIKQIFTDSNNWFALVLFEK